jgi:hypothetical protein
MDEDAGDDASTGRWVTYDELAKVRGIERIGAVRLVQRKRWRRQRGNDGRSRVPVPLDGLVKVRGTYGGAIAGSLAPEDVSEDVSEDADDGARDDAGTIAAFERAMAMLHEATENEGATLRETTEGLREGLDQALAQVADEKARGDRAETRADKAEASLADERVRADQVRHQVDELRAQLAELREDDAARRAMSRWRRAWDGWRGR